MTSTPDIFANGYTALKGCKHGFFLFNRNDLFIGRALDLYGEWCEREIDLFACLIRPGDVAVDVGANIGTHTIALAQLVTESGLVVAIEAQRTVHHLLVANVALNNMLHVLCLHNAVGATAGVARVPFLHPGSPNNFGGASVGDQTSGEPVTVVPIDGLQLATCRLIKVDVEGMEAQVLQGARRTLERHRPYLFVETTLENSRAVIAALHRLGYDCRWHLASYYNPANFRGNPLNVFPNLHPESNLICAPPGADVDLSAWEPVTGPDDNWPLALDRIRQRLDPGPYAGLL